MKPLLLIAILLTITSSLVLGQDMDIEKDSLNGYYVHFDINGLTLGEDYTEKEIRAALIPPTSIEYVRSEYSEPQTTTYYFQWGSEPYEEDRVAYCDYTGLGMFYITSKRFKIFEGQITVGDHLDKITKARKGELIEEVSDSLYYYYSGFDYPIEIEVDENKIITLLYFIIRI